MFKFFLILWAIMGAVLGAEILAYPYIAFVADPATAFIGMAPWEFGLWAAFGIAMFIYGWAFVDNHLYWEIVYLATCAFVIRATYHPWGADRSQARFDFWMQSSLAMSIGIHIVGWVGYLWMKDTGRIAP